MQCITMTLTRYHTCSCTFSLSLAWLWAICIGLPRLTANLFKKYQYAFILINLTVSRGKPLKIVPKFTVTPVVMHSSYANALHCGLSSS